MSQSNFMWDRATPGPPFRPAPGVESDQKQYSTYLNLKHSLKPKSALGNHTAKIESTRQNSHKSKIPKKLLLFLFHYYKLLLLEV